MPSWQRFTEFLRDFVFYCVLLYTVSPPRYSATLRSFLEFKTLVGAPSWHVFVQIPQNWKCTLCTGSQNPQCFVTPSWNEASNNSKLKSKNPTDRRTYLSLQMHIYNMHSQNKYNTHRQSHKIDNMQEKLLWFVLISNASFTRCS